MTFFDGLVIAQYAATTLSSGFNAGYFFGYRSPQKRRRIGAVVLTVVSLAMLIESFYFGLFVFFRPQHWQDGLFLDPRYWLGAGLFAFLGSILITGLILRHLLAKNHINR